MTRETETETQLKQARRLAEAGNEEAARHVLLRLLRDSPDNPAALQMLGGSYFCAGRLPEAEMVFERLILLQPGNGRFSIALFNTLWQQGRGDEAVEEIRRFMTVADKDREKDTIDQYVAISKQLAGDS